MRPGALERGQHAFALYRTDDEHWDLSADFLAAGLTRGERVLCLDEDGSAAAVLRRMAEDGLDPRPYRARGQLVVEPAELPPRAAGVPAGDVAAGIGKYLDDALDRGFPGFRMAFETAGVLRGSGDVDWLLEIDAACTPMWDSCPIAGLCQVDERLTAPAQHAEIRRRHAFEVTVPARYDDGQLRITGEASGHRRIVGEVDVLNREALRRELARAVTEGPGEIRLSLASLRFADAAALRMVADTARAVAPDRRIVLERPGRFLRRLLALCGLDRIPNLEIERDAREEPA
ncbi:MAG: MEDS domain-containing protein [Pseudonocardia sp.]